MCATLIVAACSGTQPPLHVDSTPDAATSDAAIGLDAGLSCKYPLARQLVVIGNGNVVLGSGTSESVNVMLDGMVSAHGRGVPETGVPRDLRDVSYDPQALSYIRVVGTGYDWIIMFRDIESFGVDDGTMISAEVTHHSAGYSTPFRSLTLRVAGELVFYYGLFGPPETGCWREPDCPDATRVREAPEGFRIQSGRKLCDGVEGCGDWSLHALELEVPGGEHSVLLPGEQRIVGNFRASGDDVWDGALRCVDGTHGRTQIVLSRAAAELL
ncbi:MAG TPA: hypothetical protein VFN67_13300 [Polyangiales bacterium]|nr:hypothetical protein [Polyangiales bacterium]